MDLTISNTKHNTVSYPLFNNLKINLSRVIKCLVENQTEGKQNKHEHGGGMGHGRSLSRRKTKSTLTGLRWELKDLLSVCRWQENSISSFTMKLLKIFLKSRNKIIFWQDRVSKEENLGPYTQETGVLSLSHVHSLLSSSNWWLCSLLHLENNTYILLSVFQNLLSKKSG